MSRTAVGMEEHTIEISHFRDLAVSIYFKLCHESPTLEDCCIFRVPKKLRQHKDNNVFDPIIVSIGPLHRHGDGLARMEQIKWWYLNCFLHRYQNQESLMETLGLIVEDIGRTSLKRARRYYAESINLSDNEFIEMMVVDGCFLIELFIKNASIPQPKDDPIFSLQWAPERLHHDLILLENQIPWFVLQKLYNSLPVHEHDNNTSLPLLVLCFFKSMMLMDSSAQYTPTEGQEIKHILDLLHSCLLSPSEESEIMLPPEAGDQKVPSVTDLLQAGVKFKAGASGDIFNIKFSNGEFKIPPILIKSNSESLFRNLIAYEQCDNNCTIQFTSYALFLDCLINTVKDVDVLYRSEILQPELNVEDMSLLFNKLYNDTLAYRCYYGGVARKINKHYYGQRKISEQFIRWVSSQPLRWRRWIATLKSEYFRNPWKISSVLAAILILIFTGIQTVIAMLAYYNVPHF